MKASRTHSFERMSDGAFAAAAMDSCIRDFQGKPKAFIPLSAAEKANLPSVLELANIAQSWLDSFTQGVAQKVSGDPKNCYGRRRSKDLERYGDKVHRKGGETGFVTDVAATTVPLWDAPSAKRAVDIGSFKGLQDRVIRVGSNLRATILTIDNSLTTENPIKAGYPNINMRCAFPISTNSGERLFVGEIQFIPGESLPYLELSHEAYEAERAALIAKQRVEEQFRTSNCRSMRQALTDTRSSLIQDITTANYLRVRYNREAGRAAGWLNIIRGYKGLGTPAPELAMIPDNVISSPRLVA